jgi:para-aminobenzoate synthetase component 1
MSEASVLHRCLRFAEVEPFSVHELAGRCDAHELLAVLENPGEVTPDSRWAYFCVDPIWSFRSKRSRCIAGPFGYEDTLAGAPLDELAALLERFRGHAPTHRPGLPPFCGGAIGYLGYELLHELEDVPDRGHDDLGMPDIELMIFDVVFACDLLERRGFVLATGFAETEADAERKAAARLRDGLDLLAELRTRETASVDVASLRSRAAAERARRPRLSEADLLARGITPTIDRTGYLASIAAIQAEILRGNAFEVCLTQRFDVALAEHELQPTARPLYEVLRAINPAPMSAYLRLSRGEVLSASPEQFLRLDRSGRAQTRPIKGTRPRGRDDAEDRALAEQLRSSEKDRAENLMIVDLCRNDLGKLAEFGSVSVTELCGVCAFEFTWQMVSTIEAQLRPGLGPVDLLRACFPGGSMTGAPKVEALKIIERLEPTARGVFSGAIGMFDFDGALDLSIVIRTLIRAGNHLSFHVGGAIVADSDPADEYQETLDKAHGLVLALELARAGGGA